MIIKKTSKKPQYDNRYFKKTSKKPQDFFKYFYYLREKYYITIYYHRWFYIPVIYVTIKVNI